MYLNKLRDQVNNFLQQLPSDDFSEDDILKHIDLELSLLKESRQNKEKMQHQIYDVFFLLLELAAKHNLDLDKEWKKGEQEKNNKYLS